MAEEKYSVEAVLSASDRGFTSGIKKAHGLLGGLTGIFGKTGSGLKGLTGSFIGANLAAGAISKGIGLVTSGASSMVSEINSSAKAWKTFEGNEKFLGRSSAEIAKAKGEMQSYASATVYSASDMASTYAQLDAVGTKNVGSLVKGMGGLAAATDNPQQAMKTLSQQMTQMAAKPTVAWQDYKLMLEQTPAGMAAVAKELGMSMSEMQTAIQDGTLATDDFQAAVIRAGNSKGFQDMATQFKTVDQAIDGTKEGLANRLMPVFDKFNAFGIKAVTKVGDALSKIDFGKAANSIGKFLDGINIDGFISKISSGFSQIGKFMGNFADTGAISAVGDALGSLGGAVKNVAAAFGATKGDWTSFGTTLGNVVKSVAKAAGAVGDFIGKMDPGKLQEAILAITTLATSFKIFNFLNGGNPVSDFLNRIKGGTKGAGSATSKLGSLIKSVFTGIGTVIKSAGTSIATVLKALGPAVSTAAQGIGTGLATAFQGLGRAISMVPPTTFLALAVALVALGASVYITALGFQVMANAAIALGQAGTGAQVMFGLMLVGLVGLVAVLGVFAPALTAGAIGILALGAAAIMLGIAIAIVATQAAGISQIILAFGTAISQVAMAIGMAVSMILTAFAPLMPGIVAIVQAIVPVFQTFIQAVVAIAQQIAPIITSIGTLFQSFGQLIQSILTGASTVITSFGNTVSSILNSVANIFTSMGNAAKNAGMGVKLMAQGISMLVALPMGDLAGTLATVAAGLTKISGASAGLATAGAGMQLLGAGMMMFSTAGQMALSVITMLPTAITSLSTSLTALPTALTTAQTALMTFGTSAVSSLAGLATAGALIVSFGAQLTTIVTATMTANAGLSSFNAQANMAGMALSRLGSFATVSSAQITTLGASISNSMSNASTAVLSAGQRMTISMQSAMSRMNMTIRNGMSNMINAVRSGTSNMVSAFRSGGQQMVSAAQSMISQTVSVIRSGYSQMYSAGAYLTQGVASGMQSAMGSVQAAASQIIQIANSAAKAAAEIHSPSRLFRDEVGYMLSAGIAVGIKDGAKLVDKSFGFIQDTADSFSFDTTQLTNAFDSARASMNGSLAVSGNQAISYSVDDRESSLLAKMDELIATAKDGSTMFLDGMVVATNTDTRLGSMQARQGRRSL